MAKSLKHKGGPWHFAKHNTAAQGSRWNSPYYILLLLCVCDTSFFLIQTNLQSNYSFIISLFFCQPMLTKFLKN